MSSAFRQHIEITPGICGGKPRIAGHRIRVHDVAIWHEFQGFSPEEIVDQFPQLSLADVYAALSYYFDHQEQINAEIEADRKFADELRADTPSKLASKLLERNGLDDSASS